MPDPVVPSVNFFAIVATLDLDLNSLFDRFVNFGIFDTLSGHAQRDDGDAVAITMYEISWFDANHFACLAWQLDRNLDLFHTPAALVAEGRDEAGKGRHTHFDEFLRVANAAIRDDADATSQLPADADIAADDRADSMFSG